MIRKLLLACFLLISTTAHAVTVTAKVVADDAYKVFVGDASGTSLTQVGASTGNWQVQGSPFTFDVTAGQYIYVAAWDVYGNPHAWIGEFDIGSTQLLSDTTDWVGKFDASIKDPLVTDAEALAQSASPWATLLASAPNGSGPWGSVIGGSLASWVWLDDFNGSSAGYALFRTEAAVDVPSAVPLPAALPLMLSGLGVLGFVARRRKNTEV